MRVTYGPASQEEDMDSLFRYRHEVFVNRLKWDLPNAKHGLEIDEFDTDHALYVAVRNDNGAICSHARLLPTTRPYLLNTIFPELLPNPPANDDVWEISRFCVFDLDGNQKSQAGGSACAETLAATVACALEVGARRLIGVSVLGIERVLSRLGLHTHRASPPMKLLGHHVFVFCIELDEQTFDALGMDMTSGHTVKYDGYKERQRARNSPHGGLYLRH